MSAADPSEVAVADRAVDLLRIVAQLNRWATRHTVIDVPAAQVRVLALVEDLAPVRTTTLAAADSCSQPTMTQQVKRLERAGLVERTVDPDDARAALLRPSTSGSALLARTRRARAAALAAALESLDPDPVDFGAAVDLLERLLEAAHRAEH